MKIIKKIIDNAVFRYLFFGGLATLVNLGVYYLFRLLFYLDIVTSNIISVSAAIVFAYFTNAFFVFETKAQGYKEYSKEFVKFVGVRLSTMVIEVGGVWFMAEVVHIDDKIGKILIQFIVIVLNYIFSKFLVFTK
ncbi:MAG: GtrA family protein [Eubacterium sp.]|nr:GtrA family protein [Eubacterium sp.]